MKFKPQLSYEIQTAIVISNIIEPKRDRIGLM